ncbi:MAG: tetratricopeptide repeat protein [Candidatus Helarchaeota archaeon]|nr:tetratricopeptide repeat protein [Candidatus Helarchaeota archaeon]
MESRDKAKAAESVGNFEAAIKQYKAAIEGYLGSDEFLTNIFRNVGECHSSIGACYLVKSDYKAALEHFNKAIEYIERAAEIEEEQELNHYIIESTIFNIALSILCSINLNKVNTDVLPSIQKAITLSENNNVEGFATDLSLFFSHIIEENISEAKTILEDKIENAKDVTFLSSTLQPIIISHVRNVATRYLPAEWSQDEVLEQKLEFENKAKDAENAGDYLSAIKNYSQALKSLKSIGPPQNLRFETGTLLNRGAYLATLIGNFDDAIKQYKEAISVYLVSDAYLIEISRSTGDSYSSIGACYLAQSKYKAALEHFEKAIEFYNRSIDLEEEGQRYSLVECTVFNLALSILCLINLNNSTDIMPYLRKATVLSQKYNIEGFAKDLCLFFLHVTDESTSDAYANLNEKLENATNVPVLSSTLHATVMALVMDFATRYIPAARTQTQEKFIEEKGEVILTRKIYEDMLLYGLTFANRKIPHPKYQEVMALIVGKLVNDDVVISEIVPMASGTDVEVEFKEEHYAKAAMIDSKAAERNEFIVGWFHTHPRIGLFLSPIDIINQLGYQALNEKAIAIVFDFTQMTLLKSGFGIFRLDNPNKSYAAYHSVRWRITDDSKNLYFDSIAFYNNFLAILNNRLAKKQQMSLTQLAEELNRSELMLEEIIPKLIELQYLPSTSYNPETKIISKN